MDFVTAQGLILPFVGTVLGASMVFVTRQKMSPLLHKALSGFAAGVMVAASIWSLLLPSLSQNEAMGHLAFVPALFGFWLGTLFLLLLDHVIPHLHRFADSAEGPRSNLARTTMMVLAVILHNIPEGMAVGIVIAGVGTEDVGITAGASLALTIGIAIQNFPEGAIISLPLYNVGAGKQKSFLLGVLSGMVEPLAATITVIFAKHVVTVMPVLLSFASGAMMYVVVEELIPEMAEGKHSDLGVLMFAFGFTLMMSLDILLG